MPWHRSISHLLPLETAGAPQPHVCLASTRQGGMNSPIWRLHGLCCFGISCQHRKRFVFACQWKCSDFGRPSGLPCYLPAVLPLPLHHQSRLVRGKHSVVPIPICVEVVSRSWPHLTLTRGLKQWCWPAWQGPTQPSKHILPRLFLVWSAHGTCAEHAEALTLPSASVREGEHLGEHSTLGLGSAFLGRVCTSLQLCCWRRDEKRRVNRSSVNALHIKCEPE